MRRQELIDERLKKLTNIHQIFLALWLSTKNTPALAIKNGYYTEDDLFNDLRRYFNSKFPNLSVKKISKLWIKFKKNIEKGMDFDLMHHLKYNEITNGNKIFNIHQIQIEAEVKKKIEDIKDKNIIVEIFYFLNNWDSLLSVDNSKSGNFAMNFKKSFEKTFNIPANPEIDKILIETGLLFKSIYTHYKNDYQDITYNVPNYYIKVIKHYILPEILKDKTILKYIRNKRIPQIQEPTKIICEICGSNKNNNNMKICEECGSDINL